MPVIDLSFILQGGPIPADHGFALFSAIFPIIPSLHEDAEVGIFPINGVLTGDRKLSITEKSRLMLRLPSERVAEFLPIAGKRLEIEGGIVQTGIPQTRALVPAPRLYSRLVTIKGFMEPGTFLEAVQRQLDALGVKGKAALVAQPHVCEANKGTAKGSRSPFLRRTIRIHGKNVVGFALRIEDLTADESILLQEKGVGGRRRFGCGLLIPDRE